MSTAHDGPSAADASLHLLAEDLLDGLVRDDIPPALLHFTPDAEGFDLGIQPLEGCHPTDLLLGFTAPADWHAMGIATGGWAYHLAERGSPERRRTRVHVVSLVSRSGEIAHRTAVHGDDPLVEALAGSTEQPTGEQIDLLRRALSMATPPPPCGTEVYWAIEWLAAVLGSEPDETVTWAEVASVHPALALLARSRSPHDDGDLIDIIDAFTAVCTWDRLRHLVAQDRFAVPELAPIDARWLDDGSFARFVLNRCPPLGMLRTQAMDVLPDAVAARLSGVFDALGVPASSWPDDASQAA